MVLPVTATKTFNQWFIENPHFYDDMVFAGLIDEATISIIHKTYGLRTICDDQNFTRFYDRQLLTTLPRYNKLLRLENTEFDALVSDYREYQRVDAEQSSGSETRDDTQTGSATDSGTNSTVRTPNITVTDSGSTTKSSDIDKSETRSDSSTSKEVRTPDLTVADEGESRKIIDNDSSLNTALDTTVTDDTSSRAVGKQAPQSMTYSTVAAGDIPFLDWRAPSTQQQSDGTTKTVTDSDTVQTSTNDTDEHNTNENTQTTTGTDTKETTGSSSSSSTASEDVAESSSSQNTQATTGQETTNVTSSATHDTENTASSELTRENQIDRLIREIWTGRSGVAPHEALRQAMSYVKISSAFSWLKDQLDVVFLSVYDI